MAPGSDPCRRALVVGAARGIGRSIAAELVERGHRVTATWHTTEPVDPPPGVEWVRCDITDPGSVDALFARPTAGHDEIVVANAAVVRDRLSSRMTDDDFEAVVDVDLTGTFRVARAALAPMATAGWGRLLVISSIGGWFGNAGQANYAAAKSGQLGMARSLAREVAPRQVTVNVLAPGPVHTELIEEMSPKLRARWTAMVPAQRMAEPAEVAAVAGFLTSEGAGSITGALVPVDGGWLA